MCKVRMGSEVKGEPDLQNLITHVILCQTGDFTLTDVIKEVKDKLTGSVFLQTPKSARIRTLCKRTLDLMDFSDTVYSYGDDCYYPMVSYPSYMPALERVRVG